MSKLLVGGIVLWLTITQLFGACAPRSAPVAAPAPVTMATQAPTKEAWQADWEKIIPGAQREGKLVVFTSMSGAPVRAFTEGFQRRHGLEVETTVEQTGARLMAMIRAGLYLADVSVQSSTVSVTSLRAASALQPLEPALILPEVKDPRVWEGGNLPWVDPEHTMLTFLHYPGSTLAINTDMVKPGEIRGWQDILNPKWKGKIVMHDPTIQGAGSSTFAALLEGRILDESYFRQLAKQEPVLLRDSRLEVEWAARGKYPIVLFPKSENFLEFKDLGSPLLMVRPIEGAHLTAGSGTLSYLKGAPRPNAATLFINWFLTKEGQSLVADAYGNQSRRNDIPTDRIPPDNIRDPAVKYFDSDTVEMKLKMPEYLTLAKDIFGHLLK